jgi:two-component system, chemotaxis family, CheB/CheR fusion protein
MSEAAEDRPKTPTGRRGSRKVAQKSPGQTDRKALSEGEATQRTSVPIVGVGASAGGVEALKEMLGAVPGDSGLAFLVVQHLDPNHDSQLASVLARHAALPVREAEDGAIIEPNTAYTIPPGCFIGLKDGHLQLVPQDPEQVPRMSIDYLFRSLAEVLQDKAICVVLSGSGADGALGLRAVRGAGGLAVVQDPDTAQFDSMPRSAIATGLADFILPPVAMAQTILDYVRHAYSREVPEGEDPATAMTEGFGEILQLLARANADFRGYKTGTLLRRIKRRMSVNKIKIFAEYAKFLRTQPEEVAKLAKEVLIAVTAFFRDPEAYEELRVRALAPLVKALADDRPVRVWVAGCSTGEEAYSIAMLLLEELQAAQKTNPLQVFASDLDGDALAFARAGVYPESITADVSSERLARFFLRHDHGFHVNRFLRDTIVFSAHNMISEPPFIRLDLITCRNVLIYLNANLQQRLISMWSFALRTEGILFLGPAETLGDNIETFEPLVKKWRIFRRTATPHHDLVEFPAIPRAFVPGETLLPGAKVLPVNTAVLAQRALVEHFGAALVMIDGKGSILYFQGNTEKYLRHPTGGPDVNLFTMARETLARRLRAAVRQALTKNEPVRIEHVPLDANASAQVNVTVKRVGESQAGTAVNLAVIFEEVGETLHMIGTAQPVSDLGEAGTMIEQLESELRAVREESLLNAAEHSAAAEELRAAHEEAVSMNEELRSTNEELETSKEELQSVNEELSTVNTELQNKNQALHEANSDLTNLLDATDIATLFLDRELRIRRFTPSATQVLNLIATDVGRPVTHISQRFRNGELASKAEQVLRTLTAVQVEVQTPEGNWYLLRVLPYRDISDRIEGVVVTFTDITPLKQARLYAESIVETVREPLLVLDAELRVLSANPAFYRFFQTSSEETVGRRLSELAEKQWNFPELRKQLEAMIPENTKLSEFEIERDFAVTGRRVLALTARRIEARSGQPTLILLAMEDVTAHRRAKQLAEAMTAEVSHRTKNGLAIVAGLLQMQVDRQAMDERSKSLVYDAISRIQAFAILYEQIQRGQVERVEIVSTLRQIAHTVRTTFSTEGAEIVVTGEPIAYSFQDCTNLVVVANELITNAIKHGAPDATGTRQIRIEVSARNGRFILSIWNYGNPVPADFDPSVQKETGLYLVQTVVNDFYSGDFDIQPHGEGTCVTVSIPEERLHGRE